MPFQAILVLVADDLCLERHADIPVNQGSQKLGIALHAAKVFRLVVEEVDGEAELLANIFRAFSLTADNTLEKLLQFTFQHCDLVGFVFANGRLQFRITQPEQLYQIFQPNSP